MIKSKAGFTLIEILVVVIIIGVLAAIALPQYQKAVWKSKNVQLKILVDTIRKAQTAYYLANGQYAGNLTDLGIDLPKWTSVESGSPYFNTSGEKDSARYNNQILIGISASYIGYALWNSGPYQGAGFRAKGNEDTVCIERLGDLYNVRGKFCAQIEQAIYKDSSSTFQIYTMP